MKLDIVMWTKNGEKTLYPVLRKVNEVIPTEIIHRKIIVDDKSTDTTRIIAKKFGWEIHENPYDGIA